MAMALATMSLPIGLGMDCLSARSLDRPRAKRRNGAKEKTLLEVQLFCPSDGCLSQTHSRGRSSTVLRSTSYGVELPSLGSVGCRRKVSTLLGVQRLIRKESDWNGIPASTSSSSADHGPTGQVSSRIQEKNGDQYGIAESPGGTNDSEESFGRSQNFSSDSEREEDGIYSGLFGNVSGTSNGTVREFVRDENGSVVGEIVQDVQSDLWERQGTSKSESSSNSSPSTPGSPSVGVKEPVYEVFEVTHSGKALKKIISRRQLLRTTGLRLRDLRRVDPSLWVTNSAPALLVRDEAILLNLGSLRAIATTQEVLIFDQNSVGARSFIETLVPRLNDHNYSHAMPFELEVTESALISRTHRVERALLDVEPRVLKLLEVLPTCMTADVLEDLRVSKQALVEVGAKAGALRQMLLELLEHPNDIRRMVIMGHACNVDKDSHVECVSPDDKMLVEDQAEEMEMLLEYYLQRCESCHGQALKLLSSAKEMEESIGVNLSSRRLEVSRLELLLQVGTFCAALGALVAGIFGMNLKSYLEEHSMAFWFTTAGIIFGGIALFFYVYNYLSNRKIL